MLSEALLFHCYPTLHSNIQALLYHILRCVERQGTYLPSLTQVIVSSGDGRDLKHVVEICGKRNSLKHGVADSGEICTLE